MPNNSLGSPMGFVSPWVKELLAPAIAGGLFFGNIQNDLLQGIGYLAAAGFAGLAAVSARAIYRYITDTPRSKIASAARGLVELQGNCEFYGNRDIQGFMSGPSCVWHRYYILRLRPVPLQVGASELPFVIRDETGVCVVDPRGARVISSSKRSWISNGTFFSSKYIHHGAQMYVIGEIRAEGCSVSSYNENAEVGGLLSQWKKDQPWLLEEFDVDANGELDQDEWASAVRRARKISRDIFEQKSVDSIENVVRRPRHSGPLLISDRPPDQLAAQFSMVANIDVVVAVACILIGFSYLV